MVSFRLDEAYCDRLHSRAERDGLSLGDAARRAVIRVLEEDDMGADAASIAAGMDSLRRAVEDLSRTNRAEALALQECLAASTDVVLGCFESAKRSRDRNGQRVTDSAQLILVYGGKLTAEQAKDLARKHLLGGD